MIAHALTGDAARNALRAGVDGLAHLFVDRAATADDVRAICDGEAFVMPCLVVNASLLGRTSLLGGSSPTPSADARVAGHLVPAQREQLTASFDVFPQGRWRDVTSSLQALHAAGVDLLAGTDATAQSPGVVFGASLHEELQLLVGAGLSPVEALHAGTAAIADRFKLADRGRVRPGLRADLVLVAGDPTRQISDTLSIRQIWRAGRSVTIGDRFPAAETTNQHHR